MAGPFYIGAVASNGALFFALFSPCGRRDGDEGDNCLLDCRSQLHFHLVAFVGQAGLYAGAHGGCVGIRGARHPARLRRRQ